MPKMSKSATFCVFIVEVMSFIKKQFQQFDNFFYRPLKIDTLCRFPLDRLLKHLCNFESRVMNHPKIQKLDNHYTENNGFRHNVANLQVVDIEVKQQLDNDVKTLGNSATKRILELLSDCAEKASKCQLPRDALTYWSKRKLMINFFVALTCIQINLRELKYRIEAIMRQLQIMGLEEKKKQKEEENESNNGEEDKNLIEEFDDELIQAFEDEFDEPKDWWDVFVELSPPLQNQAPQKRERLGKFNSKPDEESNERKRRRTTCS